MNEPTKTDTIMDELSKESIEAANKVVQDYRPFDDIHPKSLLAYRIACAIEKAFRAGYTEAWQFKRDFEWDGE